jgi:cytochrome c oxidase accessory protein FixG
VSDQSARLIATSAALARPVRPRPIGGHFQRLRLLARSVLLGLFFGVVWLTWDGRQAVLFDLPERQFHVFGLTFWPTDFHLLGLVLIIAAFGLFAVTNWLGRIFCGFACPHSVFFSLFVAIEQRVEGQHRGGLRRALKWVLWALLAMAVAVTFVGYFVPIREVLSAPAALGGWAWFWLAFFTVASVGAGGLLREQVCLYMCPYARFQSVMFDPDTRVIAYDAARGEPRGSRRRQPAAGDCVDCSLCVQVCPTGIDIRDGLQYACISCGLCVDACNGVMDRLDRPRGLIAYRSERSLLGQTAPRLRPRLLGYATALTVMLVAFGVLFIARPELALDVECDRCALFTEVWVDSAMAYENSYLLSIHNRDSQPRALQLSVRESDALQWIGARDLTLAPGERAEIPVRLRGHANRERVRDIAFEVHDEISGQPLVSRESRFFAAVDREG